ncbi:hypothetical protein KJS94_08295 [Flavihumibacter rivuli]|uniref:hypothetical protein n=1 Tax=Flavihumibacter rivuli TaxID=2838156 RepID=UPI001BDE62CF|nr:hypothetical protein [Flavihumibacter rivuli]ULQ58194.1 hypothetical protein KJS94_08295 [Flavihumibacter rivuli]
MRSILFKTLILSGMVALGACGKESATLETTRPEEYFNLQPGKYIIYQLDSTVRKEGSNTDFIVRSYQAKDEVDQEVMDNLGRKSWRIFRYIRSLNSTNEADWKPLATYLVTPNFEDVEVIDNNQRYIKLIAPVVEGKTWFGNRHINTTLGTELDYLDEWEYQYQDIGASFTPLNTPVDNTISILQADETDGAPENPNAYSARTYSKEVYGWGIGMIYKELLTWETQLNNDNRYVRTGFGIKLRMISHN